MPKRQTAKDGNEPGKLALSFFARPNGDCGDFNRFDAGNLLKVSTKALFGKKKQTEKAYSNPGHRTEDQHLSYRTAQWHDKGPTNSLGSAYPQRLPSGDYAAILHMAVARLVQLDKGALLAVG